MKLHVSTLARPSRRHAITIGCLARSAALYSVARCGLPTRISLARSKENSMKKLVIICLCLGASIRALTLGQSPSSDQKEPVYNGQPLSHWLEWLKDKDSLEHRHRAVLALTTMQSADKATIAALIEGLGDEEDLVSTSVARILGQLGPHAKSAVPALEEGLKSENVERRATAAHALWRITRQHAALEVLAEIAKDKKSAPTGRIWAALALGEIGPPARDAVPFLKKTLADDNEYLRLTAAGALWNIARKRAAIPVLVEALKSEDANTRSAAAHQLSSVGADAREAVPALATALADAEFLVRVSAVLALASIGSEAGAAVPALIKALGDENQAVRGASIGALLRIGPGAKAAAPSLVNLLKDPDNGIRDSAVFALVEIGSSSDAILPLLLKDLKDNSADR